MKGFDNKTLNKVSRNENQTVFSINEQYFQVPKNDISKLSNTVIFTGHGDLLQSNVSVDVSKLT